MIRVGRSSEEQREFLAIWKRCRAQFYLGSHRSLWLNRNLVQTEVKRFLINCELIGNQQRWLNLAFLTHRGIRCVAIFVQYLAACRCVMLGLIRSLSQSGTGLQKAYNNHLAFGLNVSSPTRDPGMLGSQNIDWYNQFSLTVSKLSPEIISTGVGRSKHYPVQNTTVVFWTYVQNTMVVFWT